MAIEKAPRGDWDGFADVVIIADESAVRRHPEYRAAKAGDVGAAKRLAAAFAAEGAIAALRTLIVDRDVLLVPVHALEAEGINRIPAAFAELLAERLSAEIETGVVQGNVAGHTGASGWQRLARPAIFTGRVETGRSFVLVDDFVGQGGTLANLRGHILRHGSEVLAAATLTGKGYSARLALRTETLDALKSRHGPEIENWWRVNFGYGFEKLTESEARYLLRAENADSIRDRILAARPGADN